MASIIKTPSGTWKAIIRKRGFPTTIKTFRIKRDAEDWARTSEDEMVRGLYIRRQSADRMTLAQALERYAAEITPTKKHSTQLGERSHLAALLKFFGAYSMSAVSPDLVAKFRDQRLADGKAANTVRLDLALLGHLYTVAMREWGVGLVYNPVRLIRKPTPGAARDRRLDAGEKSRLFAAVAAHSNPMLKWIVELAVETGMRRSEITSLKLEHVDIERRIVRLLDTKNGEPRTVPLSRRATDVMRDAIANPARPDDTRLIFFGEPGRDGQRRPWQYDRVWRQILAKQGFRDLHFHDLRHEAVSRLVEQGFSDQEVSAISGHKSMQMLKRYTHLRAEDLVVKLDKKNESNLFD
jgi:integrase